MTNGSDRAGDRLLWLIVGAFTVLAVGVGVLLARGTLPSSLLAAALVGFVLPLLRRRWAHWLAFVVLAGTAAFVLSMAWFAPAPQVLNDRLLGVGLPQARDFAAGGLLMPAALLAAAFARRTGPAGTPTRSGPHEPSVRELAAAARARRARRWRRASYAVVGAVTATVVGAASLAAGSVAADQVAERIAGNAFDPVEGPAGAPADLEPADHRNPDSGTSVPIRFDRAWTARADRAVPLPEVGLAVLCALDRGDPTGMREPAGTRLRAVDLDTGEVHWALFIGSTRVGCQFVVDTEHNAIGLLTGDAAVRLDLATGKIAATYKLPPTEDGWSVIPARPDSAETPPRAPGYLLMQGDPDDEESWPDAVAAAALDFTTGHVRELRRVLPWRCAFAWLTAGAGAEAALLTYDDSCTSAAVTALDRSGARVTRAGTVPLAANARPTPPYACGGSCSIEAAVLAPDGTAIVQRSDGRIGYDYDPEDFFSRDLVAVDTTTGKVRWRREYPDTDVETVAEPTLIGVFERRLLTRTFEGRHIMLDAGTGEVLQTWADDTPGTSVGYLVCRYGGTGDPAAYQIERGGGGVAPPWRLYRLDPQTLRPTGTPLVEMGGGMPEPVAAEGNYVFVRLDEDVMALTAVVSP